MRSSDPGRTELEAQAVAQVRDTLALIHAEDYPRLYKATELARAAEEFALRRGYRSARCAEQFIHSLL